MPQGMHSPTVCARTNPNRKVGLTMAKKVSPLKVSYCALCVRDFEANRNAKNWDRMIDALVTRGGIPRKVAIAKCIAKYGKMFGGVL